MPEKELSTGDELRADAWCGEAALGPIGDESVAWGLRRDLPRAGQPLGPKPVDPADWKNPEVGWGIVLPERASVPGPDKSVGADAPEPIRRLLAARAPAPVLRWDPGLPPGKLRRYDANGTPSAPGYSTRGTGPYAIPRYLLIVGSPAEVPWSAQYRMQMDSYVGRLDLELQGLERYVEALLGDWEGAKPDARRPVVWAVDHGHPDITRLMRKAIAERVHQHFREDPDHEFDVAAGFLSDGKATHDELRTALSERRPAFLLTSSHGATFPLDDAVAMRAQLGLLMDHLHTPLDPAAFAEGEGLHGAVWYAHACCSAGADAKSRFEGLVGPDSKLGRTLATIAKTGACSAPLPRALLGGSKPLRAFIGHVEPTFDWTLRDPTTGEVTTHHIVNALYNQLHLASRPPIGLAMDAYFRAVGGLLQDHSDALEALDEHHPQAEEWARRAKLAALDRLATVLLGDPTVRLPTR
jgi:hypothetical protein